MEVKLMAIRSTNIENILNSTAQYYSQHQFSLVEDKTPHASPDTFDKSGTWSYFDIFTQIPGNEWTYFVYSSNRVENSLSLNRDLADFLSVSLKVSIIEYFEYTVTDLVTIRHHQDGFSPDELNLVDYEVASSSGFFGELDSSIEDSDIINDLIDKFWEKINLDIWVPISNENMSQYRRPYQITGDQNKLIDFIVDTQEF